MMAILREIFQILEKIVLLIGDETGAQSCSIREMNSTSPMDTGDPDLLTPH